MSSLELSVKLSSSSDPSALSNALTLATGDFGEVGLNRPLLLLAAFACKADFPEQKEVWLLSTPTVFSIKIKIQKFKSIVRKSLMHELYKYLILVIQKSLKKK